MSDSSVKETANSGSNSPTEDVDASMGWEPLNPWFPEAQADDRIQMDGSVGHASQTPSVQRSVARRLHQAMFKKWSQARHD